IVYVAPSSQATAARSSSAPTSSQAVRPKSRSQRGAANTVESSASCADSIDGASAAAGCVGGWIRCQNRRFTRPAGGLPPRAGRYSEGRSPPAAAAANGRAAAGGFSLRGRRNVQIHPEQVVRVVLRLQLCQPLVVRAVAGADEILLLLAEAREVEVQAAGRVLVHRVPELASPGDPLVRLRRVGPADLAGDQEARVPAAVGGVGLADAAHRPAVVPDDDVRDRRRPPLAVADD